MGTVQRYHPQQFYPADQVRVCAGVSEILIIWSILFNQLMHKFLECLFVEGK